MLRALWDLTKPKINLSVLVTTLSGYLLAGPTEHAWHLLASLLGVALLVGAANTLNCVWEADIDAKMTRTQTRPLPQGRITKSQALLFGMGLMLFSFAWLGFFSNTLTLLLSVASLVLYVLAYTPLKPRSSLALFVGAVPGAMPPLLGWTANTGTIDPPGVMLFLILFVWQIPHFIAISLFRSEEYALAGLKLLPQEFGIRAAKINALLFAILLLPLTYVLYETKTVGAVCFGLSFFFGLIYAFKSMKGFWMPKDRLVLWGRELFFSSLFYLPVFFLGLAIDAMLS